MVAIYTLTSELHDEQAVDTVTKDFLDSLGVDHLFRGSDYSDYGSYTLNLIFVRTGGTEGIFKGLFPELREKSDRPFYLLTSGKSNSLAASMEILSYLRQHHLCGEIIHGRPEYIASRILLLEKVEGARRKMSGCRLGIIGKPSDWLISSSADADVVKQRLGMELVDVPMNTLLDTIAAIPEIMPSESSDRERIRESLIVSLSDVSLVLSSGMPASVSSSSSIGISTNSIPNRCFKIPLSA